MVSLKCSEQRAHDRKGEKITLRTSLALQPSRKKDRNTSRRKAPEASRWFNLLYFCWLGEDF